MTPLAATVLLPWARVARSPRAWGPIAAWFALAVVAAVTVARSGAPNAGDPLGGVFGPLALPFVAYAAVGATLGGDGLARSTRALVAYGASPARVAAVTVALAIAIAAAVACILGVLIAAIAHGPADPPLVRDLLTTGGVSLLGGAAYAALFAFGASIGARGFGRAWLLAADWVLGSSDGFAGVLTPRAHVRSLLGGEAVAELSGRWSAVLLVALTLFFAGLAVRRTQRA
jgi:hypothetical protein